MAKNVAQLEAQISKLQKQADELRAREVAGVIERINAAIQHYALTPGDLSFGRGGRALKAAVPKKLNGAGVRRTKKTVGRIKFRDQHGNAWTGHGRAPGWFKEALVSGLTREDLAVRS